MKENKAVLQREIAQGHILERYTMLVVEFYKKYCVLCKYAVNDPTDDDDGRCSYNLLPVTTKGMLCPYFISRTT